MQREGLDPPPLPDKNNYLVWDTNPGEFVYLHVLKDCVKKLRFRYDLINYQLIYRYYMLLILIVSKNFVFSSILGERCIADYYKMYLDGLDNAGSFYRRPLQGSPPKYGNQLVGVNKLKSMMKVICKKAGLEGNYSNHSGKRTCATQLYMAGVDEQEIMRRTGHRSEKVVRKYKQPCDDILKKVSAVLEPIPGVAKSLEKRKREDDMETDTELPCRPTKTLRSFGSDITNAKNGQYFQNCNISFNF